MQQCLAREDLLKRFIRLNCAVRLEHGVPTVAKDP